jgi:choline monooxygenase
MTSQRLDPDDFRVDPDPARAESLPARAFTDPAFLDLELATIFAKSWLLVPERGAQELRDDPRGLSDLLSVRGARVPVSVLDRPLFLQRGWDGDDLRAFPNACTHAWYPLVTGPTRGPTIQCVQHGRKFDCDGRYLSQPGFTPGDDFPRECDHLKSLSVARWRDLFFTALGDPTMAFDALFAPVIEATSLLPAVLRRGQPSGGALREVQGNWKQHAWNYMDRFHVTYIHRAPGGLADALEMSSYRTEVMGDVSLQWAFARDPAHGFDPDQLPVRFRDPQRRVFALWFFVFPGLTLNFYPWGLSVNAYMPVPERPDCTAFHWYHFVMDERRYEQRDSIWLNAQVDAEDVDAMAQVRRGLRSGFTPRGRFSPTDEAGPHWFHRLVSERVFNGRS